MFDGISDDYRMSALLSAVFILHTSALTKTPNTNAMRRNRMMLFVSMGNAVLGISGWQRSKGNRFTACLMETAESRRLY